ncbi:Uncharacterized protein Adt_15215 [Abeliophyllum distichum]|uniref:Uncharacterized protein n=1 Tax=Abeliophyllum distichum TaxID=126358 RepID=A0ABD1U1U8_9LAMI
MTRPRTRGARSVHEAPPEGTVAESKSETHGMEPPPPTYATVHQFETLQTQMTAMMTLLQSQIHTSADHVTSPPVDPAEHSLVQLLQEDPAAPVADRGVPHPSAQDPVDRPPPLPHSPTLDLERKLDEMLTQKIESALTKRNDKR